MEQTTPSRDIERMVAAGFCRGTDGRFRQTLDDGFRVVHRHSVWRYATALLCIVAAIAVLTTLMTRPSEAVVSIGADRNAMITLTRHMVEML